MGNSQKSAHTMYSGLNLALIAMVAVLSLACSPEFNKKKTTAATAGTAATTQTAAAAPKSYDVNVAGGGVDGTSTNFRLRSMSVGFAGKPISTSTNRTLKAGMMGRLAP